MAQYLDPALGGWAWLVGGALAVLCGVPLVLLGAVIERALRRVA